MANYAGTNKLGFNGGRDYDFLNRPVNISCDFVIDSTNANGLGIRSLKGSGVKAVYMNTLAGAPALTPAMGSARGFALLAATPALTNTGSSVITGNIGIYPAASVIGFPPGTFSGSEHLADLAAQNALTSALAAYTDLQARAASPDIATELGGQSLTAGVYHSAAGTFQITGGLTLTLTGSATDIFVFKTDTTLITGIGAGGLPVITLAGGALASNVYWAVGSSATINSAASSAGAVFKGNVIAQASITATQIGTILGSLVALTGAVTLSAANAVAVQALPAVPAVGNPNPAPGYALIQLANNYNRYEGEYFGFVPPLASNDIAINGSALTVGQPYVIVSVGHGTPGTFTIAPVADVAGSLVSSYFVAYDAYGNKFVIWFSVNGIGFPPTGVSGIQVQVQLVTNETAANVGAKLVVALNGLLASQIGNLQAPLGIFSYSASGTTTVTVVSTKNEPLPGGPADGVAATGFAFVLVDYSSNLKDWQQVGVPPGVVPAVGVSFIAKAVGYSTGGGSTGLVRLPLVSGINSIEVIGDANASLAPIPMGGSPNVGGWIMVQMLLNGVLAAPVDESICYMSFKVEAGSVLISGE